MIDYSVDATLIELTWDRWFNRTAMIPWWTELNFVELVLRRSNIESSYTLGPWPWLVYSVFEGKQSERRWKRISMFYRKWACADDVLCEAEWQYSRQSNAPMLRNPMGFMEMLQKIQPANDGLDLYDYV